MPPVTPRPIYHFTDVSNIKSIIESGGVSSDNGMSGKDFVECATADIKSDRRRKRVPVSPFGFVGDYVPFYYAGRSPTMSAITRGNVESYSSSKQLVYLVSSMHLIAGADVDWVCSDGNARTGITRFFNSWEDLESETDWQIMTEKWWANTPEDGDRKRRRMAEFLVRNFVPMGLFYAAATHSSGVLDMISHVLPSRIRTEVRPDSSI